MVQDNLRRRLSKIIELLKWAGEGAGGVFKGGACVGRRGQTARARSTLKCLGMVARTEEIKVEMLFP